MRRWPVLLANEGFTGQRRSLDVDLGDVRCGELVSVLIFVAADVVPEVPPTDRRVAEHGAGGSRDFPVAG